MKRFKHVNAESIEEATSILREYGGKARIIAGGTDLLGEMKDDILPDYPEVLVNIKNIPGLDYIREEDGGLHIGRSDQAGRYGHGRDRARTTTPRWPKPLARRLPPISGRWAPSPAISARTTAAGTTGSRTTGSTACGRAAKPATP